MGRGRIVGANNHSPIPRKRKAQTRPKQNGGAQPKPRAAARRRKPRENGPPQAQTATPRRKRPALPPPESEVWPIWCRGKLWDPATAKYYIGRCQLCEHACRPSEMRRKLDAMSFVSTPLLCTEHPESPGKLREVWPTDTCRNFPEDYGR